MIHAKLKWNPQKFTLPLNYLFHLEPKEPPPPKKEAKIKEQIKKFLEVILIKESCSYFDFGA